MKNKYLIIALVGIASFNIEAQAKDTQTCLELRKCVTQIYNKAIGKFEFDKIGDLNKKWRPIIGCCQEHGNDWSACAAENFDVSSCGVAK